MSSDCDSPGAFVLEAHTLEDIPSSGLKSTDMSDSGALGFGSMSGKTTNEVGGHLESNILGGVHSSSGGIPVAENVLVEDGYSSDDMNSPRAARDLCNTRTSAAIHAILRNAKHEREELIDTRNKLYELSSFLKKKGFSFEDVLADSHLNAGIHSAPITRDEFGLPNLNFVHEAFKSNSQKQSDIGTSGLKDSNGQELKDVGKVFDNVSKDDFPSLPKPSKPIQPGINNTNKNGNPAKNWSFILKDPPPVTKDVSFEYFPLPERSIVVSPPDEVLQKARKDGANSTNCP